MKRVYALVAWFAVVAHVAGAAALLFLLRDGLPPNPNDARLAYMASHPAKWMCGWLLLQLGVLSLVGVFAVFAQLFGAAPSRAAIALTAAGAAIDITAQIRYIVALPHLDEPAFSLLDRELEMMSGYAANGLYTLALVLFLLIARRAFPLAVRVLAVPVVLSGFAVAIGALLHDATIEVIGSAVLFPSFILWLIAVARHLGDAASTSASA